MIPRRHCEIATSLGKSGGSASTAAGAATRLDREIAGAISRFVRGRGSGFDAHDPIQRIDVNAGIWRRAPAISKPYLTDSAMIGL